MTYTSTRGDTTPLTSAQTIVKGLSADGGLYVPSAIPVAEKLPGGACDYSEHALWLMSQFFTDYTEEELSGCINAAYSAENFDTPAIAPLVQTPDVAFLELFHGRTLAFKDMALSLLPHLMTTALKKTGNPRTQVILTATSGDTGVSALEGFKDVAGTKIIIFYPQDGVSVIQKQHMITQTGKNVCVVGVKGNFDDAQSEVKRIFMDEGLNARLNADGYEFSSANSINTGRLVPQIVYYFYAYSQMVKGGLAKGEAVNFIVPTGNFGNILAGYYAKKMGLPVDTLVCASNENRVLSDYFDTGVFDSDRPFYVTTSPSMDILVPSNFERLVYDVADKAALANLSKKQKFTMPAPADFVGYYATEKEMRAAIKKVFVTHGYLIDPHTAVAYVAHEKHSENSRRINGLRPIILSTASPYKFPKTVMTSIDEKYEKYDDFELLEQMAELTKRNIPTQFANLKKQEVLHNTTVEVGGMKDEIFNALHRFL
ncbi:MAG: threonine synthase [Defluviitaleaceae bacterium]|nr:threonine synthase [Defluviitaleaceae bacterium]